MVQILSSVFLVSVGLRGPDSLPGSRSMFAICLVPWVAVSICGYAMLLPLSVVMALPIVIFELLLLLAYSRFVLWLAGKPERWPQTLVALVGVQAMINTLYLPLIYIAKSREQTGLFFDAAEYGFLAWGLLAMGNIFAKAVERRIWVGVLLSMAQVILFMIVYLMLSPFLGMPIEES